MLKRNRGYILTSTGAQKLREAKRKWETQHSARCTQEKMRRLTSTFKEDGLDTGTIRKIFKGKKEVDKESIRCLFRAFELQLDDSDLEQVKQNNVPNLITSSMKESETGDELMALAITILEQWGFSQKFKVNRTFQCIGYWLKNIETEANEFKLILYRNKENLYISIQKEILEPYLLNFKYYKLDDYLRIVANDCVIGKILVLPSNKDFFLDSLNFNYWNLLRTQNQTKGDLYLNRSTRNYFSGLKPIIVDSILLNEFDLDNISKKETYLIVNEDQRFPYTLQVCINSSKALQEFLDYFGKQIMENQ